VALSPNTCWEVRATGADTNGGGFVAGSSGVDYSQQDAAQYSVADGVTNGTTTITSATANFGTDVVGNIIYVQGGTGGIVAGWYQIVSRTNATTIVVDRTTGLTAGTGVTLKIGGALLTLGTLAAVMATSNKAFLRSGTYSTTAGNTFGTGQAVVTNSVMPSRLIGYFSARGDIKQTAPGVWANNANRPVVQLSVNTGLTALTTSNGGWEVENIDVDCASLGTSIGVQLNGNPSTLRNCKVSNYTSRGVFLAAQGQGMFDCEVTGGTAAAGSAVLVNSGDQSVVRCHLHDNACSAVRTGSTAGGVVEDCLIANNTGASSDGVQDNVSGSGAFLVLSNTIYGSGRDGIRKTGRWWGGREYRNNILAANGGYGLNNADGAGTPALPQFDGNAYWSNTSGARNNFDDTTTNPVNGAGPYTNVLDVTLTANPFTNAAGGDFTLNSTAGGGAGCRGAGTPGAFPGSTVIGYPDLGAAQHQESVATTDYPAVGNVRSGTAYNFGGLVGTMTEPATGDVRTGVQYGAGGAEFTGTLLVPTAASGGLTGDVRAIVRGLLDVTTVTYEPRLAGDAYGPAVTWQARKQPLMSGDDGSGKARRWCRWQLYQTAGQAVLPARRGRITDAAGVKYEVATADRRFAGQIFTCDCVQDLPITNP
jgi:hypothetical protein